MDTRQIFNPEILDRYLHGALSDWIRENDEPRINQTLQELCYYAGKTTESWLRNKGAVLWANVKAVLDMNMDDTIQVLEVTAVNRDTRKISVDTPPLRNAGVLRDSTGGYYKFAGFTGLTLSNVYQDVASAENLPSIGDTLTLIYDVIEPAYPYKKSNPHRIRVYNYPLREVFGTAITLSQFSKLSIQNQYLVVRDDRLDIILAPRIDLYSPMGFLFSELPYYSQYEVDYSAGIYGNRKYEPLIEAFRWEACANACAMMSQARHSGVRQAQIDAGYPLLEVFSRFEETIPMFREQAKNLCRESIPSMVVGV